MSDPNATQTVYDGLTHSPTWPTKICGPNLVEVLNAAGFYQKKEWAGLTDAEIWQWAKENTALTEESGIRIVRAIEIKLKEKNGG
jgi:hypothetical protein